MLLTAFGAEISKVLEASELYIKNTSLNQVVAKRAIFLYFLKAKVVYNVANNFYALVFITHSIFLKREKCEVKDERKTKAQLINDITELRQRVAKLEKAQAEQTQVEESLRQAKEEITRLYNASGTMLASPNQSLDIVAQTIAETILLNFKKTNCSLFIIDSETQQINRIAAAGACRKEVLSGTLTLDDSGLIPEVIRTGKTVNVPDLTTFSTYIPNWEDARSELVIPLKIEKNTIGAIDLQSSELGAFDTRDERLMLLFAERTALTLENSRLLAKANRSMERLSSLQNIDRAITGIMNLKLTLDIILDEVLKQLGVDAANVFVYQESLGKLNYVTGHGFKTNGSQYATIRPGEGYAGKAALRHTPVLVFPLEEQYSPPERYAIFQKEGFVSYYAISLRVKGALVGVLELFQRSPLKFTKEWESFVKTLADQSAIAINNAKMFDNLKAANAELLAAYEATIEGWARALEMRDAETEGHSRRVVETTMKLAWKLGIKDEKLAHIRRGALLHDIGKLAIPDDILQKPDTLTDEEEQIMRLHPIYAYDMLSSVKFLRPSLDIPLYHHERWDGTGYPEGLKGTQIPFSARIFAIVDTYDALISNRSYRDAWSTEKTIAYIKKQSGKHFDPHLVEVFIEIMQEAQ